MATALAYPEPTKRGGKKDRGQSSKNEDCSQVSSGNLSMARFVLRNCRDKALEVLRNAKYPLTVAYEEARATRGGSHGAGGTDRRIAAAGVRGRLRWNRQRR